jgi:hypothetical protein
MAVEQRIGLHRPLEVHQIARAEQPEVAPVERLLHGRDGVGIVFDAHNRQTYAVMCYALVDFQLAAEVRAQREIPVLTVRADGHHLRRALHDT